MALKVLLDPVYTNYPRKCASAFKMKQIALHLLEKDETTLIRWKVPAWLEDEDLDWLPKDERIQYHRVDVSKDRMKELYDVGSHVSEYTMYNGKYWDNDIIITNRTAQIPLMRMQLYRPVVGRQVSRWSRKIICFEDMPTMSFKGNVCMCDDQATDLQTIAGYLSADAVAICAYWEKKEIINTARKTHSAAALKMLDSVIFESTPIIVEKTNLKSVDFVTGKRPTFSIAFAGRMVVGHNFESMFDTMAKHWIYRAGHDRRVECIISTQSAGWGRVKLPSFVNVLMLGREQFWDLMINKVDIGIFLSTEEDYSLSLMEPLILGTPYVVIRCPWAEASLGKDYPFFINSPSDAYAVIREFYNDYPAQYAKFAKWSKESLQPLLRSRNAVSHNSIVDNVIKEFKAQKAAYESKVPNKKSDILRLMADEIETLPSGPFYMNDIFSALSKKGILRTFDKKMEINETVRMSFSTDFNMIRHDIHAYGYDDYGFEPGWFMKK